MCMHGVKGPGGGDESNQSAMMRTIAILSDILYPVLKLNLFTGTKCCFNMLIAVFISENPLFVQYPCSHRNEGLNQI